MDGSIDSLSPVPTTERVAPSDRTSKDKKKNGFSDVLKEKMKEKLHKEHEEDKLLLHEDEEAEEETEEENEAENKQEEQQDVLILHEDEIEDKQIEQHEESKEESENGNDDDDSRAEHVDFKA